MLDPLAKWIFSHHWLPTFQMKVSRGPETVVSLESWTSAQKLSVVILSYIVFMFELSSRLSCPVGRYQILIAAIEVRGIPWHWHCMKPCSCNSNGPSPPVFSCFEMLRCFLIQAISLTRDIALYHSTEPTSLFGWPFMGKGMETMTKNSTSTKICWDPMSFIWHDAL